MSSTKQRSRKRNEKIAIVIILSATLVSGATYVLNVFSKNVEEDLFANASDNIEETYREVAQLINTTIESRLNYLTLLGNYFSEASLSDEDYVNIINEYRDLTGFSEFYLLNENGNYVTVDDERGYIDLGDDLLELNDSSIDTTVVDGSLPSEEGMIFYVAKVPENAFHDFSYNMIAFGYSNNDMSSTLKINAYNGEAVSYLVYTNGRIVTRYGTTEIDINNIFTALNRTNTSEETLESFENGLEEKLTDTIEVITSDGVSYYCSYQPLQFQDWMIVSFVPESAVNQTVYRIRTQTQNVVIGVSGTLFVAVVISLIYFFRRSLKDKDGLILQRSIVFDMACNNLDVIYFLYNQVTLQIEYVSPNIERLLGITTDEVYENNSLIKIILDDTKIELSTAYKDFITTGAKTYQKDVYAMKKGSDHKILYFLSIYNRENSPFGVVTLTDRTEETKIRQELMDALENAKNASQAKTTFLSNVSHDMRTPMNAIVGFSDLLEKDIDDKEKVHDYVSKIQSSSKHLLNLINDVLDFSKIEAGKTTLSLADIDMRSVIRSVDSIVRPRALEKEQDFEIKIDFFRECLVEGDELRISQILINLVSNAIKYTPEHGHITLSASSELYRQYVQYTFEVSDDGIGMSEEFIENIFDPFTREVNSTTNTVQGTGLGLAITKNIIDLMGGTISVDSEKGKGSTFKVILHFSLVDYIEDTANAKKAEEEEEEELSLAGYHILCAEDNELNSEIVKALLEAEGVTIDLVGDGLAAVEKFTASEPGTYDVILMDIQMPVMDGYQASMAIRASKHPEAQTIPIIAMTANAFVEDVNNALNSGMNAHIAKPIDMKLLRSTIYEQIKKEEA